MYVSLSLSIYIYICVVYFMVAYQSERTILSYIIDIEIVLLGVQGCGASGCGVSTY